MNKLLYYGEVYGNIDIYYLYKKFNDTEINYADVIYYHDIKNKLYVTYKNRYEGSHMVYNEIEWVLFRLKYSI